MQINKKEISLIVVLIIIALVRFFFFIPKAPDYSSILNKEVSVEGIVNDIPDVRLKNERVTITPTGKDENILVILPRGANVSYGDKLKVKGVLEKPENFMASSGKEFNYERYLANRNIYYIINEALAEIISRGNGSKIKSLLFKFRNLFIENINQVISPPKSDLASGLLLGTKGGFDKETQAEFIGTGTIHIVALSGYNVTIVASSIIKFFGLFLGATYSIVLAIIFILLFIIMAGGGATVVRAGIMAFIALFARITDRNYQAGRALVIAGLLMVAYDPRVITDMSFQLSFLATAGILFITPKVISWVWFVPMRFGLREIMATTISATIAVLPALLYSTGVLSFVSLPANILVLPFIPITMLMSFLAGIVGFISPILSLPFGYISEILLSYILSVIHIIASLPFASMNIQSFPLILTILIYLFLLWWTFRENKKQFSA